MGRWEIDWCQSDGGTLIWFWGFKQSSCRSCLKSKICTSWLEFCFKIHNTNTQLQSYFSWELLLFYGWFHPVMVVLTGHGVNIPGAVYVTSSFPPNPLVLQMQMEKDRWGVFLVSSVVPHWKVPITKLVKWEMQKQTLKAKYLKWVCLCVNLFMTLLTAKCHYGWWLTFTTDSQQRTLFILYQEGGFPLQKSLTGLAHRWNPRSLSAVVTVTFCRSDRHPWLSQQAEWSCPVETKQTEMRCLSP